MRKQLLKIVLMLLCALGLWAGKGSVAAYAKEEQPTASLSGNVGMLKKEDMGYVLQVTVENAGKDFAGTVQVIFAGSNYVNTAYNTEIVLPAQEKRQFTLSVPDTAIDTVSGRCTLRFLDRRGRMLQSVQIKDIFGRAAAELTVGVLSENYAGLDFMEADGEYIDFRNRKYPLKLVELNGDTLREQLDGLYFLIIDQFDVSSLSREDIEAVQDWVMDGGWLMIGTGEYAEQTLSGFDQDFIDVSISGVSEPGEENVLSDNALNGVYDYFYDENKYYYGSFIDDGIDFTNMAVADLYYLSPGSGFYMSWDSPAICSSYRGNGSIMVLLFSLGERELQKLDSAAVKALYVDLIEGSSSYQYDNYSKRDSGNVSALSFMERLDTNVYFAEAKVMTVLYVLMAGPILCLMIRRAKKGEWRRLHGLVLGLLFAAGIYIFDLNVRVNDEVIYSVTAQRVDGNRKNTCFQVCHSGKRPWTVPLQADYEMAGPGFPGWDKDLDEEEYSADNYKYIVNSREDGLSVGIKPEEKSEGGFFCAAGMAESRGTITCRNLEYIRRGKMKGTVTNETDCDMAYLAVWFQDNIIVFSDVKAGETIDLDGPSGNAKRVFEDGMDHGYDSMIYSMVSIYGYDPHIGYDQKDMAALFIGLGIADEEKSAGSGQAVIMGVAENYDQVTAGRCNGLSYGCLYTCAEMEGGGRQEQSVSLPIALR